jgi:hypothetical protein
MKNSLLKIQSLLIVVVVALITLSELALVAFMICNATGIDLPDWMYIRDTTSLIL